MRVSFPIWKSELNFLASFQLGCRPVALRPANQIHQWETLTQGPKREGARCQGEPTPVMRTAWHRGLEFPEAAEREVLVGGPGLSDSGPEVLRP